MRVKNIAKRISALGLSLALILGTVNPLTVKAEGDAFTFSQDSNYAIIATDSGNAIDVKNVNWGNNDTMAIGEYRDASKSVNGTSVFRFGDTTFETDLAADETAARMYYYDAAGSYHPMRSEGNDFIFADPNNRGGLDSDNADDIKMATYIIKKTGEDSGVIRDATRGWYLTVNEAGEIRKSEHAEDAETFRFIQDPKVIDDTVYIEHAATGNLITFQDQPDDEYAQIKVGGNKENVTAAEKFKAAFETNDSGRKDVISFQSLSKPGYQIASSKWIDGPVAQVGSINKIGGGWEAIGVEPAGEGYVVLRDAALDMPVTVNEEGYLQGGYEGEITENEKFIIHTSAELTGTQDLTVNDSTRTETTLDLSWTNPRSLYTDVFVYQKAANEEVFTKVASLTSENSYKAENLVPGMQYTFKLCFISGNGSLEATDNPMVESNEKTAKTRAGEKPATPTNVTFEGTDKECTISWDASENATQYQIMRADSMFGEYTPGQTVNKDTRSVKVSYTNDNKYANYYRVVALNNGQGGEDISDAERSEMSEYVSLEKQNFGEKTLIFAATDDVAKVNETLKAVFEQQNDFANDAQFNGDHYQVYFKPGDYTQTDCMYLGFYTSLNGLGATPYDVKLNNIAIPAYLPAGELGGDGNNATCNFWRSTENLSVMNTGNEQGKAGYGSWRPDSLNWAVAQAAPLRRIYSERPIAYDWNYGWASGGYAADCQFAGTFEDNGNTLSAGTFSGQQFYTRNSTLTGNAYGTTLNNFLQGVEAPNLPQADGTTGNALLGGNGASNWNIPAADGGQQVFTNVETTPKLSEKPFLYLDEQGEYQVFVPAVREDTKGTSWSENDMGEGVSIPLSEFYLAKPTDTAKELNAQLADGKNIYFTPGIYHAEEVIQVKHADTVLLGSGMTTIIPDNEEGAMKIADVDGVKVAGIVFDAGTHSEYLLKVGGDKADKDHAADPTVLQDVFFRVGGTTDVLTKADDALIINSNDVIGDHFWIWRADHGAGVEWAGNESKHGLIVNGDNVTCYALFNEHFQEFDTLWNGENGATYFYQNEKCYDPISQDAWMTHGGSVNGYAAYKVADDVKKHYAVGLGIYNVFIYTGPTYDSAEVQIQMDNAIEVPNTEDVIIENACVQTFADDKKALQKFNHIINGVGEGVSCGTDQSTGEKGEGWSRKFLISYQNGTAVVGKALTSGDDKGKYIGVNTIENVKALGDYDLDISELTATVAEAAELEESKYTKESWSTFAAALAEAETALAKDSLMYAVQGDLDTAKNTLADAIEKLVKADAPNDNPGNKPGDNTEDTSNPYNEWKKTSLISPERGSLKAAGPIQVKWNRLDGAKVKDYEVNLDGKLAGTVDATDAEMFSSSVYTTNVAAHQIQVTAVLENGDKVHANTRTFYISKKGISVDTSLVNYPVSNMGESWYYDWAVAPFAQDTSKAEFVPMVWNGNADSLSWLSKAKEQGYAVVLGFNEPDLEAQANMSVEDASALQPQFTESGLRVGSAVTAGWAGSSEWFESYMNTNGDQIDFIPMHLYMGYPDKDQVKTLVDEIQKTYDKYQKPIWITEVAFASADPNWMGLEETNGEFREKTKEAMTMLIQGVDGEFSGLDALDFVERYAWFSFDTNHTYGGVSSLYETNDRGVLGLGELTELGNLYRTLGNPEGYVLPGLDGVTDESTLPEDTYNKDTLTGDDGEDKPGTDKPGTDNPGTDNPGTDKPGTDNPGTDNPGTDKPGTDNPGTNNPGTDNPGTDKPGTDNPGTDKPGNTTSGNGNGASGTSGKANSKTAAKTGDNTQIMLYLTLFGAAGICVFAGIRRKSRKG